MRRNRLKRYWQLFTALFLVPFLIFIFQKSSFAGDIPMEQCINNFWNFLQPNLAFWALCCALLVYFFLWSSKVDLLINHHIISTMVLAILLVLICLSGSAFFKSNNNKDYWTLIIPVALGILGGNYGSLQSIKTSKIEKALAYIDKWDSSELQDHRKNILNWRKEELTQEMLKKLETDLEKPQKTQEINNIIKTAIENIEKKGVNIKFSLSVISNFWEKIYILLDQNLVHKSILHEVFYDMYKTKFALICRTYLIYLSLDDQNREAENKEMIKKMKNNLEQLKNKKTWGKLF